MHERLPPRFVPTLTEVVEAPVAGADAHSAPLAVAALPAMAKVEKPLPPLQVLEVLPVLQEEVAQPASDGELETLREPPVVDSQLLAAQIQSRVMARLDEVLQDRLRYALSEAVQLQSQALVKAMRDALEVQVREAVSDALAQELVSASLEGASSVK